LYHQFPPATRYRALATLARSADSSLNLRCNGGPVEPKPKLYLIFWGDSWTDTSATGGDPDGVQSAATRFANLMGGSRWLNTVTQYFDPQLDHAGNTTRRATIVRFAGAPPAAPQLSDLAAVATQVAQQYDDFSVNSNYVVLTPHGIAPTGFPDTYCAWHSTADSAGGTIAFTNLPYQPDAGSGCGANVVHRGPSGLADGVSIILGHEAAEVETDPLLNAWFDSAGNEMADKCAWQGLAANPNAGGYPTQPLWSNASSSCVQFY
jgi:hypothetical protein